MWTVGLNQGPQTAVYRNTSGGDQSEIYWASPNLNKGGKGPSKVESGIVEGGEMHHRQLEQSLARFGTQLGQKAKPEKGKGAQTPQESFWQDKRKHQIPKSSAPLKSSGPGMGYEGMAYQLPGAPWPKKGYTGKEGPRAWGSKGVQKQKASQLDQWWRESNPLQVEGKRSSRKKKPKGEISS